MIDVLVSFFFFWSQIIRESEIENGVNLGFDKEFNFFFIKKKKNRGEIRLRVSLH